MTKSTTCKLNVIYNHTFHAQKTYKKHTKNIQSKYFQCEKQVTLLLIKIACTN